MKKQEEFPGGPLVRTPYFHCRRHKFDLWSGNLDPLSPAERPKKKKKKKKKKELMKEKSIKEGKESMKNRGQKGMDCGTGGHLMEHPVRKSS